MSELITPGATLSQHYPQELSLQAMEAWSLIPADAQTALLVAASDAVTLAEAGGTEAGRAVLVTALRSAEDNWKGNPWGEELVLCHREMLDRYTRYYLDPHAAYEKRMTR